MNPDIATQSGPMLVINGRLHPRFVHANVSLKQRSGVGVREPQTVVFAISDVEFSLLRAGKFAAYAANLDRLPWAEGAIALQGDEMLLHQGAAAFQLWTGREAPVDVMRRALLEALG